ncbi:cytochrome-c peroxidase [Chitinophaga tropicalis]|nr:cytochrome c peroxidase [Chitinophaga tropicalis]
MVLLLIACLAGTGSIWKQGPPRPYKVEYPSYFGNRINIPEDNPLTEEGVRLGRMLFYETALSSGNRISCASCHKQELAFTDGLQFSIGVDGTPTPRNSMSLANLLWVRNFFWDGRAEGLEKQAETPLTNPHEMGQALAISAQKLQQSPIYPALFRDAFGSNVITDNKIVKALSQFERTLISSNSTYDQYLRGEYQPTASELNGITLFFDPGGAGCGHCHGGPKTFSELFHNNGLDSIPEDAGRKAITGQEYDNGRFRVATLRNIALTAPYMHDGRFKTLEEVADHYSDHIQASATLSPFLENRQKLTMQEKKDLVAFLHLLTDSTFITDKRFSNPFK